MASQTSVSGVTHVTAEYLVYARHTSAASPTTNKLIGASGRVRHSDASEEQSPFQDGASVGCVLPRSESGSSLKLPPTWAVKNNRIFEKPAALSLVHAAALPSVFIHAFACVCEILKIPPQSLIGELSHGLETRAHSPMEASSAAILILGGETPVGSAIIQLLGVARPSIFLLSTIAPMQGMEADEQALSDMSIQQVMFGARYTIEHAAEDLIDHLRAALEDAGDNDAGSDDAGIDEVDVVVDATGDLGDRAQIIVSAFSNQRTRVVRANDLSAPTATESDRDAEFLSTGAGEDDVLDTECGDPMLPLLARLVEKGRFTLPDHLRIIVHPREGFQEADVQANSSGMALVAMSTGPAQ